MSHELHLTLLQLRQAERKLGRTLQRWMNSPRGVDRRRIEESIARAEEHLRRLEAELLR